VAVPDRRGKHTIFHPLLRAPLRSLPQVSRKRDVDQTCAENDPISRGDDNEETEECSPGCRSATVDLRAEHSPAEGRIETLRGAERIPQARAPT